MMGKAQRIMQKSELQSTAETGRLERVDLGARTEEYALAIIRLFTALPRQTATQVLGKQLLRSGTSVGAHYCEAKRARSAAEFISKMEGGFQELEESKYWLRLLSRSGAAANVNLDDMLGETNELLAIFTSSVKTAKRNAGRG